MTSKVAVLAIISSARARYSSSGASLDGIGLARIGVVGMTRTSKRDSASSYAARRSGTRLRAIAPSACRGAARGCGSQPAAPASRCPGRRSHRRGVGFRSAR